MADLWPILRILFDPEDDDTDEPGGGAPPGTPPTQRFEGPWFSTQITLSLSIGLVSFFLFSYCRTRWPVLFAPRTKLKGFSPHEAHAHQAFFGWIMPTIRTSEFTVLQIVGLDAAVLLNFFKMSFRLFLVLSTFAVLVIMPINLKSNLGILPGEDEYTRNPDAPSDEPPRSPGWLDLISDANNYLFLQLIFTYIFTLIAMRFLYKNYTRFIRSRQLYSLELVHSIAPRTVMVTNLPNHLQGERTLAIYFESMGLNVESVNVCRDVKAINRLLEQRTKSLLALEKAWVSYVGNPSVAENYDRSSVVAPLVDIDLEGQAQHRIVVPNRARPSLRPGWFKPKVDAIEYLQSKFEEHDGDVRRKRKYGKLKATGVAFVTFEKMSSAQIASQVLHASRPSESITCLAPEPRDIVWSNVNLSPWSLRIREVISFGLMALLLLFWTIPIGSLASLLSYKEIKKIMPWLGELIDQSDRLRAIVLHSLPSVGVIALNALLPFILEFLAYFQGLRARSWIEYSMLRRYFLFLLVNVIFIFLLASTYWQVVRDFYERPGKIPEKLADALHQGTARNYFVCYVILQGLGIIPLQLLNLGVVLPNLLFRIFVTRTPRDYAELNAPPMINYGAVYPQAILIFIITLLYSVIQPLILLFGTVYFGLGYVVYKYKLLFVFYKPYESQGEAWPITFARLTWGIIIFQVFMTGIFTLRKSFVSATLMTPLILFTVWWSWYIHKEFKSFSSFVSLSSVCEVQRGEDTDETIRLKAGHPVSWSQSNLNRRRYAENDETLYVAPEDQRTDYSQPPMTNWYYGVLNTGKRRYGHPALTGVLPQPWLPLKKNQSLANHSGGLQQQKSDQGSALVLTLRKRYSVVGKGVGRLVNRRRSTPVFNDLLSSSPPAQDGGVPDQVSNPWSETAAGPSQPHLSTPGSHPLHHQLSFDQATGVIMLPENGDWLEINDSDSDVDYGTPSDGSPSEPVDIPPEGDNVSQSVNPATPSKRHGTYFHHPEKRRQTVPGAYP